MKLIWVDDDSFGILSVIERKLRRNGFNVERFRFFEEAEEYIKKNKNLAYAFLIDFILPTREIKAAPFLGMEIAQAALQKQVKFITFLSVVAKDDVKADLDELSERYPNFDYKCFNKAELVEKEKFDELIVSLRRQ